ncbi:hypothetical protein FNV43_RR08343 [Rhamnella rubrinervis]|uniref:Uncharacterized protein n=1 Tax=Rhamnella rubrinervis TaxID=2594499 RepID=A0A8K0HH15_9ROSA|nr:hypothetical protein FNV43_RR08343 [Rhamnella rubrinervis]
MGIVQPGEPILILPLPPPMFAETKGNRSGLALKASSSSPVDLSPRIFRLTFNYANKWAGLIIALNCLSRKWASSYRTRPLDQCPIHRPCSRLLPRRALWSNV